MINKHIILIVCIIGIIVLSVCVYTFIKNRQNFTIKRNIKGQNKQQQLKLKKLRQIKNTRNKLNSLLRAAYVNEEKQVDTENVQDTILGNNYFLPDVNFCKLIFPGNNTNKIFKDNVFVFKNNESQSEEISVKTFSNDNPLIQRVDLNDIETNFTFRNSVEDIVSSLSGKISINEKMPTKVVNVTKTLNDILNSNDKADNLLSNFNENYFGLNYENNKKTFSIYMLPELRSNKNYINKDFLDKLIELTYAKNITYQGDKTYIQRNVNDSRYSEINNSYVNEESFTPYIEFMKTWGSHIISSVTFGKSFSVWEIFNKDLPQQYNLDNKRRLELCKSDCLKFHNKDNCLKNVKETFDPYIQTGYSTPTPTPYPGYSTPTPIPYYSQFTTNDIVNGLTKDLLNNPSIDLVSLENSDKDFTINPLNCQVSKWSDWSDCSLNCGGGKHTRNREIISLPKYGGETCPPLKDTQYCNTQPCPIDCEVGEWSEWGNCNVLCGGGLQERTRKIIVDPKYGGRECPVLSETQQCNTQPCPVNCEVGNWSDWDNCSEDCDGGIQKRTREIVKDVAYGGETCPPLSETQICNTQPCVICDSNFCSHTDYSISYGNYCLRENCEYPYTLNDNNGNLVCQLNLDEKMKNLINLGTDKEQIQNKIDYLKKLFKIKQAYYIKNTSDANAFPPNEIEDAKILPTMKTISIIGGLAEEKKDIYEIKDQNISIDANKLLSFITKSDNYKPIQYEYIPIWSILREIYSTECYNNNINSNYIYNLQPLNYNCTGIITDENYIERRKNEYKDLFANPNLPLEIVFGTNQMCIDEVKNLDTKFLNIENFKLQVSNSQKTNLGQLSSPLSCNKIVISSDFKLNNESYFGNGYNIKTIISRIISGDSEHFIKFNNDTNFNYILTFGVRSEKIEDITVSMVILDIDENVIDLKFNNNSLVDPNLYYNLSFKNDSSDLQNLLELDIKFSLNIPIDYENKKYNEYDINKSSIVYFEGKFVLYKDKILSLNDPLKSEGNKVTNKQFYVPTNLNQIKNFSGNTKTGNINLGKVKNSGKVKSLRIRGIISDYNTQSTKSNVTLNIGSFSKDIIIEPKSEFLQQDNLISIISENKYLTNKDNKITYSDNQSGYNSKWIIRSDNNSNFINSGDIITISTSDTNLQLFPKCVENKYSREFRDIPEINLGTCPDGWKYLGNKDGKDVCETENLNKGTCTTTLGLGDEQKTNQQKSDLAKQCNIIWSNCKVLNEGEIAPTYCEICNTNKKYCDSINGQLGSCPDGWRTVGNNPITCLNNTNINKGTCNQISVFPTGYNKEEWAKNCNTIWTNCNQGYGETMTINQLPVCKICNEDEDNCRNNDKCYKKCNNKYHTDIDSTLSKESSESYCALNCIYDENPLELGCTLKKDSNDNKWKIEKVNNTDEKRIKKGELLKITSLNNCGNSVYAFLTMSDNSNVVISKNTTDWSVDISNERELYLNYTLDKYEQTDISDEDDIIISSNAKTFTLTNLNIDIEIIEPPFITFSGKEIFSKPNWFSLTRNSLFSYTLNINDIQLLTGPSLFINSNELLKYFSFKSISEFSPFPLFSIENFNIELWGHVNSAQEDKNYDVFNKFCKKETKRSSAMAGKRSVIRMSNNTKQPVKNVDGINYYDVIYLDESVPESPVNVLEIFVPEDAISVAQDSCKILQAAYNLEAAYIFSSKTLCPKLDYSKGPIQKIVPIIGEKGIIKYGCWNRASGCQADDECEGITTDEHINHKDAFYGRGAGWIPDVHCPNRSCSNRQGIGFASWCDNSPTVPWDLNICSSDKDCGKDGEQWGGFCYPKCRDGYDNTGCCICSRMAGVDSGEYERVKYCTQDKSLFHEVNSSPILGNPDSFRTIIGKPENIPSDGTGRDGQYSCAADNARVNNLNETIRNVAQVGKDGAPCKCQNPYTIPGKSNEPKNATWNILPDRLIWEQI